MRSRSATISTVVGASDAGMDGNDAVAGFSITTVPPAAFTACAPEAPSDPLPVRITAMSRSAKTSAAELNSRSTDGLGPLPSW